ncbi:E3 ubiquitin-protein ligase HERC2 [Portunus trituberculatus]|uniref:E3 ubiquitin-protein ligase HERC2 n=1 Tax=Portunus trituberculatus TaxID=210409 RepID=A0A5B7K616_PORTR|nr:E3 ubiquitin-protein ligase HERC2 [Portunus trituberculatus]
MLHYFFAHQAKKINRVACGSAHTLAWSTSRAVSTGRLPSQVPIEYDLLKEVPLPTLRNRLVLLHHFSDLVCQSISMFDLCSPPEDDEGEAAVVSRLRAILVSSAKETAFKKVRSEIHSSCYICKEIQIFPVRVKKAINIIELYFMLAWGRSPY